MPEIELQCLLGKHNSEIELCYNYDIICKNLKNVN